MSNFLYHGTSGDRYEKIKTEGLKSRGDSSSMWEPNTASHPKLVYLSTRSCEPEFHALHTCLVNKSTTCCELKIDADKLDEKYYCPDEYYVASTYIKGRQPLGSEVREIFKRLLEDKRWQLSISQFGVVGYKKQISPDFIELIRSYHLRENRYYSRWMQSKDGCFRRELFDSWMEVANKCKHANLTYEELFGNMGAQEFVCLLQDFKNRLLDLEVRNQQESI